MAKLILSSPELKEQMNAFEAKRNYYVEQLALHQPQDFEAIAKKARAHLFQQEEADKQALEHFEKTKVQFAQLQTFLPELESKRKKTHAAVEQAKADLAIAVKKIKGTRSFSVPGTLLPCVPAGTATG